MLRASEPQPQVETTSGTRPLKLGLEASAALAGTAVVAFLLVLKAMYAGPLWRDEVNTANVAQMASLGEFWQSMTFESFPPLWPLLVRGLDSPGLAGSDASIRGLGLGVGLFFLVSLWLCARWLGSRTPIVSIGLLGSLPAFFFIVGANRAYGLASCLLVLSFGLLWRMVEWPSRSRIFWAGLTCLLFAQCVYYDVIFLAAMLAGGALVALRHRHWKTLGALTGIGAVSAASLTLYLPIISRGSPFGVMIKEPSFNATTLMNRFEEAVAVQSSARVGSNWQEIWLWIALIWGGTVLALFMQRPPGRTAKDPSAAPRAPVRSDLAVFCSASMLLGVSGYFAFLLYLKFATQTWYYVEMLCLCAISLDGILGASWPGLRPWGWLRVGFMLLLLTGSAKTIWAEAHTRRSNVDLIAAALSKNAAAQDLIVVQTAWEGITFNRYYHGRARWLTVPPIDSHLVHRNDLILEQIDHEFKQQAAMAPVLQAITNTLTSSNAVWLVGTVSTIYPRPSTQSGRPDKRFGIFVNYWSGQVTELLLAHARREQVIEIPVDQPVSWFENRALTRFSGFKTGEATTPVVH